MDNLGSARWFEIRPAALEREGLAAMISRVARDGPWLSAEVDIAIERQSRTVEALCYRLGAWRKTAASGRHSQEGRSRAIHLIQIPDESLARIVRSLDQKRARTVPK